MNVTVSVLTLALVCLPAAPAAATGIDSDASLDAVRPPAAATALEASHKPPAGFEANSGQLDKFKAGGTKVVQKGRLSNGQTPLEYLTSAGGAGVLTVRNASGATATVRLRFN